MPSHSKNSRSSVVLFGRTFPKVRFGLTLALTAAAIATPIALYALNPNVPPGSNFNLSVWDLTLPIGSPGSPDTISHTSLKDGFTDEYFFTNSNDGSMALKDPGSNCVTTPNSEHCRTEFSEVTSSGSGANWSPSGTNILSATLTVNTVGGGIVIGQIHLEESVSTKPLIELFYETNGDLYAGIEQSKSGGDEIKTYVGHVSPGTKFSYVIDYSGNDLSVTINGGKTNLAVPSALKGIDCFFKAGDYGQSSDASKDSFYALTIQH